MENQAEGLIRDVTPDDSKVWRKCGKCGHKWQGVPSSSVCPKCKKYVRPVKKVVQPSPIRVESQATPLPPLPGAPSQAHDLIPRSKALADEEDEATKADIPADTYSNIAAFPFDLVGEISKKPHWKLTAKEKATLAPLLKKVGDKWIGKWFDKYPEEGALALTFALVISGKIAMEASYQAEMKRQENSTHSFVRKQQEGLRNGGNKIGTESSSENTG